MKKIRLLLVDDEKTARDELSAMLQQHSDFEIVASAPNGQEALTILEAGGVDALFLDIEMPLMTGLELANILGTWPSPPRVVFATAHNQYAVTAFEANAVDYILKPYQEDRLAKALEKIKTSIGQGKSNSESLEGLSKSLFEKKLIKKMAVRKKNSKDRIVMDPVEFDYFHAESAEVFAHAAGQDYVSNMTLKDLGESLAIHGFAPCHKAYLVNLTKIEKISPLFNGNFEILLKNNVGKVPLSRRFAKAIREKVGGW